MRHIVGMLENGVIDYDDAVVILDSDGQHLPRDIDLLIDAYLSRPVDHVIACRDLSIYPLWKRLGNRIMSLLATILTQRKFSDVECGMRLLRAGAIPEILRFYVGVCYSNGQEMAIISSLLGHRIFNGPAIRVMFYRRRGTTGWDGAVAACYGILAALRVRLYLARSMRTAATLATPKTGDD